MFFKDKCHIAAVGAHPDDIEYGCLGALLLAKELHDARVSSIVLTQGELAGARRSEECFEAFKAAGLLAPPPEILRERDGEVHANPFIIEEVSNLLADVDVVLTMTRWDTHQDHRAVNDIVFAAVRRRPVTLIGYHVLSSTASFPINLVVDIEAVYPRKLASLAEHRSQLHKEYFSRGWVDKWHQHRMGSTLGLRCVEAFHVYQMFA